MKTVKFTLGPKDGKKEKTEKCAGDKIPFLLPGGFTVSYVLSEKFDGNLDGQLSEKDMEFYLGYKAAIHEILCREEQSKKSEALNVLHEIGCSTEKLQG
jgi:hypothetical protein